jgi:DNA-binding NtrC family response regulator
MMPTLNGIEFLKAFHETNPGSRTVIFVMTAGDDTAVRHLPPNLIHGFVRKPFDVPQLVSMIREVALTRCAHEPETRRKSERVEASGEMRQEDSPN